MWDKDKLCTKVSERKTWKQKTERGKKWQRINMKI